MSEIQNRALNELSKLPSAFDALAVLEALQEKRKREQFIKFWAPKGPDGRIIDQQASVFPRFTSNKKIFSITGGNRSGKTELGSVIACAYLLGKSYFAGEPAYEYIRHLPIPEGRPRNIWVVGLDFPTVRDVIWREKLRNGKNHPALIPTDPKVIRDIHEADYQIFAIDGSVLTCKSADSGREKFQGASVDLVWIDEECEAAVFDECYQRTADCEGRILITLTPLTDIASGVREPWVFDLYTSWKEGQEDIEFCKLSVLENPYVPDTEKTKLKEKWSGHFEERARLYGDFIQRSGLVYPMWTPIRHLIKPFFIPVDWPRVVCIDPAATGVTAALWAAVDPSNNLYFYREYYGRDAVVSEHAKNILVRNSGDYIDTWLIDPQWGRQRNAETHKTNAQLYKDSGIPVRVPEVGEDYGLNVSMEYLNATVNPTVRARKAYFFQGRLPNFESEIAHYIWDSYQRGQLKGQSKEKPRKGMDHLMNCFQYMCAQRPHGKRASSQFLTDADKETYVRNNSYTTLRNYGV